MEENNVVTSADSALVRYLDAKRARAKAEEALETAKFKLIHEIKTEGSIMFTDGESHKIATVKHRLSKSLNKVKLAEDTGNDIEELDVLGLVEMAERGDITSSVLEDYYEEGVAEVISIRKMSKEEISKLYKK